jgi:hypothetical protein
MHGLPGGRRLAWEDAGDPRGVPILFLLVGLAPGWSDGSSSPTSSSAGPESG